MLYISSLSAFYSSEWLLEKKLVGGICLGSPTTIIFWPRAMAPTASQVGIWEASSKITRSNFVLSTSKYWATEMGLMSMQGHMRGKRLGMRSNSFRMEIGRAHV